MSIYETTSVKLGKQPVIPGVKTDPENYKTFIDLPEFRRAKGLKSAASQFVLGHIVGLVNEHYRVIEVNCGNEKAVNIFRYTKAARQAQEDVADLDSERSRELIGNRTSKSVEITRSLDGAGNTIVLFEIKDS
ncbi:MAG: hypothetical protein HY094_05125 [Candidatus Melainabacteria bacterium]|nr:hypothetical protein [Candidatus Melainabacteria bacterium]